MALPGFSRLFGTKVKQEKAFGVPPFSSLFRPRARTVIGPSAKPTTVDISWFSTPLRHIKQHNHPKKIKKITWHLQKKVTGITSRGNKFNCFYFFWWRKLMGCNSGTKRLIACQSNGWGCTWRDGPLKRHFFWHSITNFLQGTDESTWLWNAGPRGPPHLYMYFQTASFWDFPCKFVWFFQHFGFVLLFLTFRLSVSSLVFLAFSGCTLY